MRDLLASLREEIRGRRRHRPVPQAPRPLPIVEKPPCERDCTLEKVAADDGVDQR